MLCVVFRVATCVYICAVPQLTIIIVGAKLSYNNCTPDAFRCRVLHGPGVILRS